MKKSLFSLCCYLFFLWILTFSSLIQILAFSRLILRFIFDLFQPQEKKAPKIGAIKSLGLEAFQINFRNLGVNLVWNLIIFTQIFRKKNIYYSARTNCRQNWLVQKTESLKSEKRKIEIIMIVTFVADLLLSVFCRLMPKHIWRHTL